MTKKNEINVINKDKFMELVKDSFQFKRKTLRNNLKEYDVDKIEIILNKYGFDLSNRAEAISVDIFIDIANQLFG